MSTTLRRARTGLYTPPTGGGGGGGGATFVSTTNGTSATSVTKPSGLSTGDHLLVVCADQYADITMTGFLDLGQYLFSTSANYEHIFYRQIDGSESSSFTVSGSGATNYVAVAYRGGYGPPALINGTPYDHVTSFDNTYYAPVDGTVIHVFSASETSTGTLTPPGSGVTSRGAMTSTYWSVNISDEHASAGGTATRTATPASTSYANALAFMIPDAAPLPAALGRLVTNNGNSTNASITIPSYAAVGDMFICQFEITANTLSAGPVGFTAIDTANISGGNYTLGYWIGYKVLESGDPGSTINVTSSSQVWGSAGLLIRNPGSILLGPSSLTGHGSTATVPTRTAASPTMAITGLMYSNDGAGGYVAINPAIRGMIWREARAGGSNYGGNEMAIQAVPSGNTSVAPAITVHSTSTWAINTILMSVGTAPVVTTYSGQVLASYPLTYLKLDETSGTAMADSSGNGRGGTASGVTVGASSLQPDGTGKSVTFPGPGNIGNVGVTIAQASWMETPAFTHEMIFMMTSSNGHDVLVCRDDLGGGFTNRHSVLYIHGVLAAAVHGTVNESDLGGPTIVAGVKYHAVLTFDGTVVRAYLNGRQLPVTWSPGALNLTSTMPIALGYSPGFGGIWSLGGNMDEYSYYGVSLSAAQVRARFHALQKAGAVGGNSYDAVVIEDDPLAFYTFNDASGAVAVDKSGAYRPGVYASTYTHGVASIMPTDTRNSTYINGGIAQFPSDYSQTGMKDGFALEGWFKLATHPNGFYGLITKWENGSGADDGLIWRNTSGFLALEWYIAGSRIAATSSIAPALNTLYHVVGEYTGRALNLYVNGTLAATQACSGPAQISSGCHINWGSFTNASWYMDGQIQNGAVYDHPLGATRVAAHYAAG